MPTGYTADLYEGKEVDFPTFVLSCARAFGPTILLRDHDLSVLPTEENVTSNGSYHERSLQSAKETLERFSTITDEELKALTHEYNVEQTEACEKALRENEMRKRAYSEMLINVQHWEVPTEEHEGLKDFMLQQLRDSLKHDCHEDEEITRWYKTRTPEEHRAQTLAKAGRDIAYHTEEMAKDQERDQYRRQWVRELYESLGLEVA